MDNLTENPKLIAKWQNKLLPVMVIVPISLATIFIVIATMQMLKFNEVLNEKPDSKLFTTVIPPIKQGEYKSLESVKWATLAHMEQQSIEKRYRQGGLLLMSRIFTKYLGFFTGMLMAIVGSVFIISKLNTSTSTIDAAMSDQFKVNVASSSPGLIFGVLGTILMGLSIYQHTDVSVQDSPLYLNAQSIMSLTLSSSPDTIQKKNSIDTSSFSIPADSFEPKEKRK